MTLERLLLYLIPSSVLPAASCLVQHAIRLECLFYESVQGASMPHDGIALLRQGRASQQRSLGHLQPGVQACPKTPGVKPGRRRSLVHPEGALAAGPQALQPAKAFA